MDSNNIKFNKNDRLLCLDIAKTTGIVVSDGLGKPLIYSKIRMDYTILAFAVFYGLLKQFNITHVFYEKVQFSRARIATECYAKLETCVSSSCLSQGINPIPVLTGDVKKALSGKGNANKKTMVAFANKKYNLKLNDSDHDIADALGILAFVEQTYLCKIMKES